ncbi:hypothetical protein GGX14DRAFT_644361 [Mycena pura]|uniref:Uncharacterized protein n=1 Tax=Mycena pura TaxID=153505 RepID=A0AAD6VC81_9AGAR|nr:hypothetical protein GGX14DRAFT_644361 [Mycena pura]
MHAQVASLEPFSPGTQEPPASLLTPFISSSRSPYAPPAPASPFAQQQQLDRGVARSSGGQRCGRPRGIRARQRHHHAAHGIPEALARAHAARTCTRRCTRPSSVPAPRRSTAGPRTHRPGVVGPRAQPWWGRARGGGAYTYPPPYGPGLGPGPASQYSGAARIQAWWGRAGGGGAYADTFTYMDAAAHDATDGLGGRRRRVVCGACTRV